MTPDDIKRIAIECGDAWGYTSPCDREFLDKFAHAIRNAALEEAAGICEKEATTFTEDYCAAAIREAKS